MENRRGTNFGGRPLPERQRPVGSGADDSVEAARQMTVLRTCRERFQSRVYRVLLQFYAYLTCVAATHLSADPSYLTLREIDCRGVPKPMCYACACIGAKTLAHAGAPALIQFTDNAVNDVNNVFAGQLARCLVRLDGG